MLISIQNNTNIIQYNLFKYKNELKIMYMLKVDLSKFIKRKTIEMILVLVCQDVFNFFKVYNSTKMSKYNPVRFFEIK